MNIDATYKRRIRIECDPDKPYGRRTHIIDVETGEDITNVTHVMIYLDPRETNVAKLTYFECDERGQVVVRDGEPVSGEVTIENSEIALTVWE